MNTSLSLENVADAVRKAFRAWFSVSGKEENSLGFLQIAKRKLSSLPSDSQATNLRLTANSILEEALTELENQEGTESDVEPDKFLSPAKLMRETYLAKKDALQIALAYGYSRDHIFRLRGEAINKIAEILLEKENQTRAEIIGELEKALPPKTYRKLFGVEQAKQQVLAQLLPASSTQIITITGIGGIGKTALAQEVCQAILPEFAFERVVWLRVDRKTHLGKATSPEVSFDEWVLRLAEKLLPEQDHLYQRVNRIRAHLNQRPHLIVFDDLETEAEIRTAIIEIQQLDVRSKFLITSRAHTDASNVFAYPMRELSHGETLAFIRYLVEATQPSLPFTQKDAEAIYEIIGGNPLAIRMVVDLARDLPLKVILEDIPQGKIKETEKIYTHIYKKTWEELQDEARAVLMLMPMTARAGTTYHHLAEISQLPVSQLAQAIQELRRRSLLEVTHEGDGEIRYSIHRLTENFIRKEILQQPHDAS